MAVIVAIESVYPRNRKFDLAKGNQDTDDGYRKSIECSITTQRKIFPMRIMWVYCVIQSSRSLLEVLRDAKSSVPWGNWLSLEVLVCSVGYMMAKKTE